MTRSFVGIAAAVITGCTSGRAHIGLVSMKDLARAGPSVRLSVSDARAASENPLRRIETWADDEVVGLLANRVAFGLSEEGVGVVDGPTTLRVEVLDWWWLFTSREPWVRSCVFHVRLHASLVDPSGQVLREATVTAGDELGMVLGAFDRNKVVDAALDTLTRAARLLVAELGLKEARR